MAVYGVVYDLTNYASKYSGGSRVVVNLAGTPVMSTNAFDRYYQGSRTGGEASGLNSGLSSGITIV